jgi:translation elongation factor EF-G
VVVPDENIGTVLGDLQQLQALIQATDGNAVIACEVALARLLRYATELRSLTHGRGQFSMQFQRIDRIFGAAGEAQRSPATPRRPRGAEPPRGTSGIPLRPRMEQSPVKKI